LQNQHQVLIFNFKWCIVSLVYRRNNIYEFLTKSIANIRLVLAFKFNMINNNFFCFLWTKLYGTDFVNFKYIFLSIFFFLLEKTLYLRKQYFRRSAIYRVIPFQINRPPHMVTNYSKIIFKEGRFTKLHFSKNSHILKSIFVSLHSNYIIFIVTINFGVK
jgi:hypothetical protein